MNVKFVFAELKKSFANVVVFILNQMVSTSKLDMEVIQVTILTIHTKLKNNFIRIVVTEIVWFVFLIAFMVIFHYTEC